MQVLHAVGLGGAAVCLGALLLAVGKVLALLLKCYRAKRQFMSSPIPGPPLSSFLFGHIPELIGSKGPWTMAKWAEQYGPVVKLQFLELFTVMVTDPAIIARITRKTGPGPYLPKPHAVYEVMETSVSPRKPNILSSTDDQYWRAVRQATAPCFSITNLKQVVPMVLLRTKRAADRMAQYDTFDVTDAAKRITSDVMGELLYGEDLRGTFWEPSEYLQVLYPVFKAQSSLFDNPFHLWQLWDAEVRHQRRCLKKHNQLMEQKVQRLRKIPPAPHTIAAHILSAIDPTTGKPLDDTRAKGEIAVFMAAGFETTSHSITWTLSMLSAFPEVQDEVFAELQAAGLAPTSGGSTAGRDFEASDLGRLPLLSAVIKEALRLCTPVPYGGSREVVTEEGADLGGYHVPKGTHVMITLLPYGLSKCLYGPDALEFKPQRWMTAAADAPASPTTPSVSPTATAPSTTTAASSAPPPDPLTFLTGARDCIGQNLAKLELQVVLATLLARFKFSPGPELDKELRVAAATGQPAVMGVHALAVDCITMQPASGHMELRIEPRR